MMGGAVDEQKRIYHERQRLQFCLLHTLNNLFQEKSVFSRSTLNEISNNLDLDYLNEATSWNPFSFIFKPHHNELTGNYDVNILISALEGKGKSVIWHDKRIGCSSINLENKELFGIILNVCVRKYRGLWKGRHWVALRRIDSIWYNLDSDICVPQPFINREKVWEFLDSVLYSGGEVFIVMNNQPT